MSLRLIVIAHLHCHCSSPLSLRASPLSLLISIVIAIISFVIASEAKQSKAYFIARRGAEKRSRRKDVRDCFVGASRLLAMTVLECHRGISFVIAIISFVIASEAKQSQSLFHRKEGSGEAIPPERRTRLLRRRFAPPRYDSIGVSSRHLLCHCSSPLSLRSSSLSLRAKRSNLPRKHARTTSLRSSLLSLRSSSLSLRAKRSNLKAYFIARRGAEKRSRRKDVRDCFVGASRLLTMTAHRKDLDGSNLPGLQRALSLGFISHRDPPSSQKRLRPRRRCRGTCNRPRRRSSGVSASKKKRRLEREKERAR